MVVNPMVLFIIADRLAQPRDDWKPFNMYALDQLLSWSRSTGQADA
jgi:hypothetical protein